MTWRTSIHIALLISKIRTAVRLHASNERRRSTCLPCEVFLLLWTHSRSDHVYKRLPVSASHGLWALLSLFFHKGRAPFLLSIDFRWMAHTLWVAEVRSSVKFTETVYCLGSQVNTLAKWTQIMVWSTFVVEGVNEDAFPLIFTNNKNNQLRCSWKLTFYDRSWNHFPARFNHVNPTTFEWHTALYNQITDDYFDDIEVMKISVER